MNTFPVAEDYARFTPQSDLWPLDTTYIEYHGEYNVRFPAPEEAHAIRGRVRSVGLDPWRNHEKPASQALANSFNMEYCRSHKYQK